MARRTPLIVALASYAFALAILIRLVWPGGWPVELAALFHHYVAIGGALLLLVALLFRVGLSQLVLAVAVGAAFWPLLVSGVPIAESAERSNLRIMSANVVHGIPSAEPFGEIIAAFAPDIVVMQEIAEPVTALIAALPDYPHVASPWAVPQGVVVISRHPMTHGPIPGLAEPPRGAGGGLGLRAEIAIPGDRPLILYAIHAPTPKAEIGFEARARYLDAVAAAIAAEPEGSLIVLAGDWNTPPWSPTFTRLFDTTGLATSETSAWPGPTRIIRRFDFIHWLGSPVDHIAVSPQIAREAFTIGPDIGSDHLPVIADLLVPES
ncbi:MAG: endonuclease/exonuclease/phosphatase family protein [Bauldia sp.]|nr:endonuclease/exonuclease/phosphatase family protein [Bauldia sp.]